MKFQIGTATRVGNRSYNEDDFTTLVNEHAVLLVLADGMGGHDGGRIASKTFVDSLKRLFHKRSWPTEDPVAFLTHAILRAHDKVNEAGERHDPPISPRTTCVLCLIQNGYAWWAHLGDSRLYLFRHGEARFRTRDHSRVEELLDQGLISVNDALDHPLRNQLTRCVGGAQKPTSITLSKAVKLETGDTLLLCTDGLWGPFRTRQLADMVHGDNLDDIANHLAEQAEQATHPKSDNITLIMLRWLSRPQQATAPTETKKPEASPAKTPEAPVPQDDLSQAIAAVKAIFDEYEDEIDYVRKDGKASDKRP